MEILKRKGLIDEILEANSRDNVKLLKGVRGVGKTTLIKSIIEELNERGVDEENILYVSFISPDFYWTSDYIEIYDKVSEKLKGDEGKKYLFLDHVEEFEHWQSLANAYRRGDDCDVIVAVNYSKFYKPPERNVLGGRTVDFDVYPFSFREFITFKRDLKCDERPTMELFEEYLLYGGMPEVVQADKNEKFSILECIYNVVKYWDMIRDSGLEHYLVEGYLRYMVDTFTEKFSRKDIEKYLFEFENGSLYQCEDNLENSCFMVASNAIYSGRGLRFDKKFYLVDHGFFNQINWFYWYADDLVRNIVFIELLRRGYKVFFSETNGKYVDYIAIRYGRTIFIQFDYLFTGEGMIQKEIDFLNYHAKGREMYIITTGEYDFSEYGVKHLNIIDFLLGDEI